MLQSFVQDTRYAARVLRATPLFTVTAALSLAIGIGANVTIFSVATAMLLRPLPGLADPGRLVDIGRTQNGRGFDTVSYPNYRDFRSRTTLLEDVYALRLEPQPMSIAGRDGAERVYGTLVTANYFTVLGTRAHLGRLLRPQDDDVEGATAPIVVSHDLWERRYAGDPEIVGRAVVLNGHPFTVVGVAPRGFQGTTLLKPDLWVPMSMAAQATPRLGRNRNMMRERRSVWLVMGGRLKPGVSLAQANAEATAIGAALEREYPDDNRGKGFAIAKTALVPGRSGIVAGFLGILLAIVGLVLLTACANVAGMLLARAAARRREIAVRVAIGAGRWRVVRQMLTETTLLFAVGGAIGLIISRWLAAVLLALLPQIPMPLALEIRTDWRVTVFAVAVSLVAAVLSGLAPALTASRSDLVPALKAEGLNGVSSRLRLRNAFLVGQITLSLVLILAAGLLLRALQHASNIQPGFDQTNVEVVSLDLSLAGYDDKTGPGFLREMVNRIRALPGVDSASAAIDLPLDGGRFGMGGLKLPGTGLPEGRDQIPADWNVVEPGYFRTLKLPLTRGRDFAETDTAGAPLVAIVNEALARLCWPGLDPIGRELEWQRMEGPARVTVIAVAADARLVSLNEPAGPFIYVPLAQQYIPRTNIVVRSAEGRSAVPAVRTLVRDMNPNLPITEALPLDQVTAAGLIPQRIAAAVSASLGSVALLLAAVGIFGVTSYSVTQRTREVGIRMALGADRRAVLQLVLRQGLGLAAIGIAIGLLAGAAGSRLLQSLLFGVSWLDPVTFIAVSVLFLVVTLAATYVPARRATKVDPILALRAE